MPVQAGCELRIKEEAAAGKVARLYSPLNLSSFMAGLKDGWFGGISLKVPGTQGVVKAPIVPGDGMLL